VWRASGTSTAVTSGCFTSECDAKRLVFAPTRCATGEVMIAFSGKCVTASTSRRLVLSANTVRVRLRPAAAPIFGQQAAIFQENQGETRPQSIPLMWRSDLTRRENDRQVRLS